MAVGTVTPTVRRAGRVDLAWVSDADGRVTQTPDVHFEGLLQRVVFVPGTPTPDTYSVTLEDDHGIDVLAGQGAGISAVGDVAPGVPLKDGTTTSTTPPKISGSLTVKITGAGNAKQGTLALYFG
jgi:hypothetical protein